MVLYYIMDTQCGWCYGFSETIKKVAENLPSPVTLVVLPGGMWVGDHKKVVDQSFARYIRSATKRISDLTGKQFGEGFLERFERPLILDSLPGSLAIEAVKTIAPESVLRYLSRLHEASFLEGEDTEDVQLYFDLAEELAIDIDLFEALYDSEENKHQTYESFEHTKALGATSYPSLILEIEEAYYPIDADYNQPEAILKTIQTLIA